VQKARFAPSFLRKQESRPLAACVDWTPAFTGVTGGGAATGGAGATRAAQVTESRIREIRGGKLRGLVVFSDGARSYATNTSSLLLGHLLVCMQF